MHEAVSFTAPIEGFEDLFTPRPWISWWPCTSTSRHV